eukprot:CAMPEP_0114998220 /NCGR_PEP_ID=MMETSP0216-20121206/15370_1 /TAXON_ID=223996 /ORGANISM="Protocruzia adherens, Strain Boccale" /LENGTH=275 /DNA_ID=CAMNT_0002362761 /DNA_START=17 /DNA_END=844 /DNA_ORIENTATION=-
MERQRPTRTTIDYYNYAQPILARSSTFQSRKQLLENAITFNLKQRARLSLLDPEDFITLASVVSLIKHSRIDENFGQSLGLSNDTIFKSSLNLITRSLQSGFVILCEVFDQQSQTWELAYCCSMTNKTALSQLSHSPGIYDAKDYFEELVEYAFRDKRRQGTTDLWSIHNGTTKRCYRRGHLYFASILFGGAVANELGITTMYGTGTEPALKVSKYPGFRLLNSFDPKTFEYEGKKPFATVKATVFCAAELKPQEMMDNLEESCKKMTRGTLSKL